MPHLAIRVITWKILKPQSLWLADYTSILLQAFLVEKQNDYIMMISSAS